MSLRGIGPGLSLRAKTRFGQMILGASGQYEPIREGIELRVLEGYVADNYPLAESANAYDARDGNLSRKGDFVLRIRLS